MGRAWSETEADTKLEADIMAAVLHLREHGWAIIGDVLSRCIPATDNILQCLTRLGLAYLVLTPHISDISTIPGAAWHAKISCQRFSTNIRSFKGRT